MANHPSRKGNSKVRRHLKDWAGVERVRYDREADSWHVYRSIYRRRTNTNEVAWVFAGYTSELLKEIAREDAAARQD